MNEFQAAMGLCNLKYIDAELQKRSVAENRYRERLSGIDGIKLSTVQEGVTHNHAYFPALFDGYKYNRDEVASRLAEENIFARKYFYPITNEFSCYRDKFRGETPIAKHISENVLTLPMYADLTEKDVDRICDIILK